MFAKNSSNFLGVSCVFASLLISEKTDSTQTSFFWSPFLNLGLDCWKE